MDIVKTSRGHLCTFLNGDDPDTLDMDNRTEPSVELEVRIDGIDEEAIPVIKNWLIEQDPNGRVIRQEVFELLTQKAEKRKW